jgi:hypothetical protein
LRNAAASGAHLCLSGTHVLLMPSQDGFAIGGRSLRPERACLHARKACVLRSEVLMLPAAATQCAQRGLSRNLVQRDSSWRCSAACTLCIRCLACEAAAQPRADHGRRWAAGLERLCAAWQLMSGCVLMLLCCRLLCCLASVLGRTWGNWRMQVCCSGGIRGPGLGLWPGMRQAPDQLHDQASCCPLISTPDHPPDQLP